MRLTKVLAAAAAGSVTFSLPAWAKSIDTILRLKERVSIESLAASVQDPTSPRFGNFYTPAEIRQLAAPSDADYQALKQSLTSRGLQIVSESPTHLLLTVRGDHSVIEQSFGLRVTFVSEEVRTATAMTTVPEDLTLVESVSGLDNRTKRHHHYQALRRPPSLSQTQKFKGVPLAQIRTLYAFDSLYQQGLTGNGQHIAIATYNGFNISDVNQYYSKVGLNPAPQVDQVAFNGKAPADPDSAVETEVDAEFSGALAPGASIHVFASATSDDAGELQMFTAILDDNRAKVVNYSWGACESDLTSAHHADMDKVFARAVAQGVNILVASGDSGSSCKAGGPTMADWPAEHPDVLAIGGTSLDLTAQTLSETAWSDSGGGISTVFALPTWQNAFQTPYLKRSYPDVAFNADQNSGQAAWVRLNTSKPAYQVIGGTSIAAPQWSGFLTLVGEARASAGKGPIGQLAPIIYAMSQTDQAASFNDVTSGSNGQYSAGPGWDAVTGLGSMKASALLQYLVEQP